MKRYFRFFCLLAVFLAAFFAAGCGHKILGVANDRNMSLIGKVKGSPMKAPSSIAVHFPRNIIVCRGVLVPGTPEEAWGECGGTGVDTLMCNGDIPLEVKWAALNCTQGYAAGKFPSGETVDFSWGFHSLTQANVVIENKLGLGGKTADAINKQPRRQRPSGKKSAKPKMTGSGSAFFVSHNGLLITNYHVIKKAGQIYAYDEVTRKSYLAEILAIDARNDLAVLKTDLTGRGLALAPKTVRKGQDIIALGYPVPDLQGQAQKAVFGRVNSLTGMYDDVAAFQMDAPIQPGNSGGPVLDMKGEVVGVSTYTVSAKAKAEYNMSGVFYAVKVDYVRAILNTLPKEFNPVRGGGKAASMPELIDRCEPSVVILLMFDK